MYDYVHTGDDESTDLSKVQFGIITEENLVYLEGKDDHFVFEGMTITLFAVIKINT